MTSADTHTGAAVLHAGLGVGDARIVAVMIHGRGASAEDILGLAREFTPGDVAYLAPQAAGGTWYPYSFMAPIERNEPALGSALRLIARLLGDLAQQGVASERIALMGFSQGACLSLEFAARHAQRYACVVALSGGLIGPPGTPREYGGAFADTPFFLGCSDVDPHIPLERVRESSAVLGRMGAKVDERIYRGMGHTVNRDELEAVDALLAARG